MILYEEEDLEPLLHLSVSDLWDFFNRCNSANSDLLDHWQKQEHSRELCLAIFNYGIVLGNLTRDILWAAGDLAEDKTMEISCLELITAIDRESKIIRELMQQQTDRLMKEAFYSHARRLGWLRIKVIEGLFDHSRSQTANLLAANSK